MRTGSARRWGRGLLIFAKQRSWPLASNHIPESLAAKLKALAASQTLSNCGPGGETGEIDSN